MDSILLGGPTGSGGVILSATGGQLKINGSTPVGYTGAPGASGATGATGQLALDSDYLYVCIGTDTWKRTALTGW